MSGNPERTQKEALMERLQYLWAAASNSCGSALPHVLAEIKDIEKKLSELEETA